MNISLAGSAVTYEPNDDQLGRVSLEFAAFDGEVGGGQLPVPDQAAAITVAGGRAALVEEGATVLTDAFILDHDRARGPVPVATAREYSFGILDANALLGGFRVTRSRPSETDVERVLAFAAIDGPSWDTTMVINASTVTMPKKKYDGTGWDELITDTVEFTGKTLFLHDKAGGGRCLHYHVLTSGHTCGLTISDVIADVDGVTTYFPGSPVRTRTSVDLANNVRGRDQQGRTKVLTDATSIAAHDADGLQHEALVDFETTGQSDLNVKTAAFLASQKDELDTWTCIIGPLDEDALALIRVGDLITTTSSVMGLTASVQRISHMTLTVAVGTNGRARAGWWMAALELGAPIRRRARVKVGPAIAATVAPYLAVPPYIPVACAGAWDNFDDRTTVTPDWGSTSGTAIPWSDVLNVNSGAALSAALASGWVSGGLGYLRSVYVTSNGLPSVHVTSGPPIGASDWEVLFRFRIPAAPPDGANATIGASIFRSFGNLGTVFAWVLPPNDTPILGSIEPNTWYLCRFGRDSAGPTYRWKTWLDGTTEPTAWLDTAVAGAVVTAFGFTLNALYSGSPPADPAELHIDWISFDGSFCEAVEPVLNQFVTESYGESDGATTDYRTRAPYMSGSLEVYADDIREWNITETDPTTGDWAFDTAPFATETIRVEYRAA